MYPHLDDTNQFYIGGRVPTQEQARRRLAVKQRAWLRENGGNALTTEGDGSVPPHHDDRDEEFAEDIIEGGEEDAPEPIRGPRRELKSHRHIEEVDRDL